MTFDDMYVCMQAQNIANKGELQGSGMCQSCYLSYQKGRKA